MRSTPITLWSSQALAASGTVTTPHPQLLDQAFGYAVQIVWTGTADGTFALQGSCDKGYLQPSGTVTGVSNWSDLGLTVATSGSAGNKLFNVADVNYRWLQIVYTASSGTGTASAVISMKGI